MKIALTLTDGRNAADFLAQVTVANAHGEPVMVAYHGPAGAIVCGHAGEDGWYQFLDDTGAKERIEVSRRATMHAKITPIKGSVSVIPVMRCIVYSDQGDPVIAAVVDRGEPSLAHAGDRRWHDFCKQHEIYVPRKALVQELN